MSGSEDTSRAASSTSGRYAAGSESHLARENEESSATLTAHDMPLYLNNRAGVLITAGNLVDADEALRAAFKKLHQSQDHEIPDTHHRELMILTLNNLGVLYRLKGQHEQAVQYLESASRIEEESSDSGVSAATLINLSSALSGQGNFGASLRCADAARIQLFRRYSTPSQIRQVPEASQDRLLFGACWFHSARGLLSKFEGDKRWRDPRIGLQVLLLYRKALHANRGLCGVKRSAEADFMLKEYGAVREKLKALIKTRLPRGSELYDPPAFPGDDTCSQPLRNSTTPLLDALGGPSRSKAEKPAFAPPVDEASEHAKGSVASEAADAEDLDVLHRQRHERARKRILLSEAEAASSKFTKELRQRKKHRRALRRKLHVALGGRRIADVDAVYGISNKKLVSHHSPKKQACEKPPSDPPLQSKAALGSKENEMPPVKDESDSSRRSSTPGSEGHGENASHVASDAGHEGKSEPVMIPRPPPRQPGATLPPIDAHRRQRHSQHPTRMLRALQPAAAPAPLALPAVVRQRQLDSRLPPILFVFPALYGAQALFHAAGKKQVVVPALSCIYAMLREEETLFPKFDLRVCGARQSVLVPTAPSKRQRAATFLNPDLHDGHRLQRVGSKRWSQAASEEESKREEMLHKRVHSRVRRMRVLNHTSCVLEAKNIAVVMRSFFHKWAAWSRRGKLRSGTHQLRQAAMLLQRANEKTLLGRFFRHWFAALVSCGQDGGSGNAITKAQRRSITGDTFGNSELAAGHIPVESVLQAAMSQVTEAWLVMDSSAATTATDNDETRQGSIEALNVAKERFVETLSAFLETPTGNQETILFSAKIPSSAVADRQEAMKMSVSPFLALHFEDSTLESPQNTSMLRFFMTRLQPFCSTYAAIEENAILQSCVAASRLAYAKMILDDGFTASPRGTVAEEALEAALELNSRSDRHAMLRLLLRHADALQVKRHAKHLSELWRVIAGEIIPGERGYSLLGEGGATRDLDLLEALVCAPGVKIDLNHEYDDGQTLLTRACGNGDAGAFEFLMREVILSLSVSEKNAVLLRVLSSGTTALFEGIVGGEPTIVRQLLLVPAVRETVNDHVSLGDILLGLSSRRSWTPLSFAVHELDMYCAASIASRDAIMRLDQVVRHLLEFGAKDDDGAAQELLARVQLSLQPDRFPDHSCGDSTRGQSPPRAEKNDFTAQGSEDLLYSPESLNFTFASDIITPPIDHEEAERNTLPTERRSSPEAEAGGSLLTSQAAPDSPGLVDRQNQAATKIQAIQRRRSAMREIQRRRNEARAVKGKCSAASAEDERIEKACLILQCAVRQQLAHASVRGCNEGGGRPPVDVQVEEAMTRSGHDKSSAAITLQCEIRKFLAQSAVESKKVEKRPEIA